MRGRIVAALCLALCAGLAFAAGPSAVRKQTEMSMLVTGMVLIDPDGSVTGWEIDQREKLPVVVANLIEKSAPAWRFEPVTVDGSPRRAKAPMSLRVVANRLDDGNYRIAIRSGHFGEEALDTEERRALGGTDSVQAIQMRPPSYSMDALYMGVQGTVYLVLRIDREGRVAEVAAEQVDLRIVGDEREMRMMRDLLAKPALIAARKWTFRVPTTGEASSRHEWSVRVPVDYTLSNARQPGYGEWQAYIPGPRQAVPWRTGEDADAGQGPEALVAGQVYEVGKGLKLLTPLQG